MRFIILSALMLTMLTCSPAWATDAPPTASSFQLILKNHAFSPTQLTVPANQQIKLTVRNLDPTPAEFESGDFEAEKIVPANGEISLYIEPLKPGSYGFYDDFHADEAKGTLLAR